MKINYRRLRGCGFPDGFHVEGNASDDSRAASPLLRGLFRIHGCLLSATAIIGFDFRVPAIFPQYFIDLCKDEGSGSKDSLCANLCKTITAAIALQL